MHIRFENKEDEAGVEAVNKAAFATASEANLVVALRKQADLVISLVAIEGCIVVGHIMFSPVVLDSRPELKIVGLAPMAVLPTHQRKGIGSALVRAGLEACRKLGFGAVVVLGHPKFYPRFGFLPSKLFGIDSEYEVSEDLFMIMELQPGYLQDSAGTVKYHSAFNSV